MEVNERWFVTPQGRYAVPGLSRLRGARGARHPVVGAAAGTGGVVLFAVVVGFPSYYATPAAWLGVAVAVLVPAFLAAYAWRMHRRPYELWADYRGATVMVFSTLDEKEYGHVTRALIRAREAHALGENEYHVTALPTAA